MEEKKKQVFHSWNTPRKDYIREARASLLAVPAPNTLSNSSRTETVRSDASSVIAALHWHPSETRNFPHAWAACVAHGTSQNHRCRRHERTVLCKLPGSCQDPRRERSEKREPLRKCVCGEAPSSIERHGASPRVAELARLSSTESAQASERANGP